MKPIFSSERLMLSIVSRVREDYRRLFPYDSLNNERLTILLHSIAWKIKEKEDEQRKSNIHAS